MSVELWCLLAFTARNIESCASLRAPAADDHVSLPFLEQKHGVAAGVELPQGIVAAMRNHSRIEHQLGVGQQQFVAQCAGELAVVVAINPREDNARLAAGFAVATCVRGLRHQ